MLANPNQNQEEYQREIDHRKLFVTNLPYNAQFEELKLFFQTFGKILSLSLVFQKNNKLIASIVANENENDAYEAMAKMNYLTEKERTRFSSRVIHVEFMQAQHRTREFLIRQRVDHEDAKSIFNRIHIWGIIFNGRQNTGTFPASS